MQIDTDMLREGLLLRYRPGDTFEVRVLGAQTRTYFKPHTESGYFTFETIDDAIVAISKLSSYQGVYSTLNPVDSSLLARAANRLTPAKFTTADTNVQSLRWLLVDCDAKRPSGISSTDAEHAFALAKAQEIASGMKSLGWPEPILADSGNGAQLFYRIDLNSEHSELTKRVLASLALGSDEHVDIDTTVYNAARICRLPGTVNCKGDPIPERPHRMARILSHPEGLLTLSEELLRQSIATPAERAPSEPVNAQFNLDGWIARHCPEAVGPTPWNGGRKWVLPVCAFNPSHDNKSAVITEVDGIPGYTCHHNGCKDYTWHDFREKLEPGCYDKPDLSQVKLSLDLSPQKEDVALPVVKFKHPGVLPEDLLDVPGFVSKLADYTYATAPYPNRVLAFTGAISMLSMLTGRTFADKNDTRTNLYLVGLADSGTGKDYPRKVNFKLSYASNAYSSIAESFASGEGLEDSLISSPRILFQVDEFDTVLNTLKESDKNAEKINGTLLKLYSSSNAPFPLRRKARRHNRDGSIVEEVTMISCPHLSLFATAIPRFLYGALTRRAIENGLVARCIFLEAGTRGAAGNGEMKPIPDDLLKEAAFLQDFHPGEGNLSELNPTPLIVPETRDASEQFSSIRTKIDSLITSYTEEREFGAAALWTRAYEKVRKLALLYAISENAQSPCINAAAISWAFRFVEYYTRLMLCRISEFVYENTFDEKCQRLLRFLDEAGGMLARRDLLRKFRESKEIFDKVLDTLVESGRVTTEYKKGQKFTMVYYKLVE